MSSLLFTFYNDDSDEDNGDRIRVAVVMRMMTSGCSDDDDDGDDDDDDWDDKGQVGSCKQEDVETGIANMNWGHRAIHNTQVFLIIEPYSSTEIQP